MSAGPARFPLILLPLVLAGLAACSSDKTDAGTSDTGSGLDAQATSDAAADAGAAPYDSGVVVIHDAGTPLGCASTCECPQGSGCIGGVCRRTGAPIWCCDNPGCPSGAACLDESEAPGSCPGTMETPDAGPRPDTGPGAVGAYCESDSECDQAQGLTCWERNEPPYLWNYCTLEGCSPACPTGSECIQFNIPPPDGPVIGCMQSCGNDTDCRADAYCLAIPGTSIQICVPDCRDDLFDCAPRDGTQYCSPMSGQCESTPNQNPNAVVGDPCTNNTQCGPGDVCMGEIAWGFPGGMCTHVCSGLTEATPCDTGETCQSLAGVGLCFRDCTGGMCPNRANAACGTLDASWVTSACIPQ